MANYICDCWEKVAMGSHLEHHLNVGIVESMACVSEILSYNWFLTTLLHSQQLWKSHFISKIQQSRAVYEMKTSWSSVSSKMIQEVPLPSELMLIDFKDYELYGRCHEPHNSTNFDFIARVVTRRSYNWNSKPLSTRIIPLINMWSKYCPRYVRKWSKTIPKEGLIDATIPKHSYLVQKL